MKISRNIRTHKNIRNKQNNKTYNNNNTKYIYIYIIYIYIYIYIYISHTQNIKKINKNTEHAKKLKQDAEK